MLSMAQRPSEVSIRFADDEAASASSVTLRSSTRRRNAQSMRHRRSRLSPRPQNESSLYLQTQTSMPEAVKYDSKLKKASKKLNADISSLWSSHLKAIERSIGSDVVVYFSMVIWLFLIRVPGIVLVCGFLVVPQLYERFNTTGYQSNYTFRVQDLATGRNWLENTELYQGYYKGDFIGSRYYMPTAYLLVSVVVYLFYLLFIAKSHTSALSEHYVEHDTRRKAKADDGRKGRAAPRIFSAWDFSICKKATANVCRAMIVAELKRSVDPQLLRSDEQAAADRSRFFFNIGMNFITIIFTVVVCAGIWFISSVQQVNNSAESLFALSLMTTIAACLIPTVFGLFSMLEKYTSRVTELFMAMFKIFLLHLGLFTVIILYLFGKVECSQLQAGKSSGFRPICQIMTSQTLGQANVTCWETWIGQEIYRWQVVDFFVVIVVSLLFYGGNKLVSMCVNISAPYADVSQLLMHLVMNQSLAWFGCFFCPLLPVVMMIKFFFFFFWFRFLLTVCCRPSDHPWRYRQMASYFRIFIGIFFGLAFGCVMATIIVLKPSTTCGPFRMLASPLDAFPGISKKNLIGGQIGELILTFFNTFGFNIFVTACIIVVLLIFRRRALQQSENLRLIRKTIQMISKDKVYYMKMLQANERQNPYQMISAVQQPRPVHRTPSGTSLHSDGEPGDGISVPDGPATPGTPARSSAAPGSPTPSTPAPVSPTPSTPAPGTPARSSPAPSTPAPGTPTPGIPYRDTPSPVTAYGDAPPVIPTFGASDGDGSPASSVRARRTAPAPPVDELPMRDFRPVSPAASNPSLPPTPPPDYF